MVLKWIFVLAVFQTVKRQKIIMMFLRLKSTIQIIALSMLNSISTYLEKFLPFGCAKILIYNRPSEKPREFQRTRKKLFSCLNQNASVSCFSLKIFLLSNRYFLYQLNRIRYRIFYNTLVYVTQLNIFLVVFNNNSNTLGLI